MGRIERVNEQLKREVSKIIHQDLADPRLQFVTITQADVSKDLRSAKVYYSVLGDDKQIEGIKECLEQIRGMVRKLIGQRMSMRYTPEIFFSYDRSIELSARIDTALKEIQNESKENA